jgi:integrase
LEEWTASAEPLSPLPDCLVVGCEQSSMNSRGLCTFHYKHWCQANKGRSERVDPKSWAATQTPYLGAGRFSLAPTPEPLRSEILFGLQRRDELGHSISPKAVRHILTYVGDTTTLVGAESASLVTLMQTGGTKAVFRDLCRHARLAHDEHRGVSPIARDVLDLRDIGITSATRKGRRAQSGVADLTRIPQEWLRDLVREWVNAERPHAGRVGVTVRAAAIAGLALRCRSGGGHDPTALQFADMGAVCDQFRNALREDGILYGSRERHRLFGKFCELVEFGRGAGLLDQLPGSFTRHRSHRIVIEDPNEDEIGKAIPEAVIRQLDANLATLGADILYGQLAPDAIQALFRTVYIILRDTGRRPGEVAALPRDCLETIDGGTSLVWDNGKGKRNRRRLPIDEDTAHAIRVWQQRRNTLPAPANSRKFLFPAITDDAAIPHLNTSGISRAIRTWVNGLASLDSNAVGEAGNPLPFDREKVFPYAFRHSYAQRHADEGTPVDVLKELMDHVDVKTTMGYYTVSLKRKQQAVKTLSARVVDRAGNPAPFRSGLAYERSAVAVPFGGCTEPSNVKAGGHACRIRFQCAGCGFYRPDPSYLPAIEQQINDLRADQETAQAMGAAEFVIHNLTEQIDAYRQVITNMRKKLAELPADERAEIEEASTIMRKARAGSSHLKLPITPVQRPDPPR